ncbi:hypothetical protein [Nonomuraea fuscirosea]|uniref:hypothetical protein n=1 Tax=Nonomuraea fuscirosea TaxID=1291556 RepID=UPI0034368FCB
MARKLLDPAQAGRQLVQWLDVDSLWQHRPWRVDERMTTMVRANPRAVAEHAATAEVDTLVITWVFQPTEMHRLVAGLLPPGTPGVSVQLHASRETWHQRFEPDPERLGLTDFYRSRCTQAPTTAADHVVDTDRLTPLRGGSARGRTDRSPPTWTFFILIRATVRITQLARPAAQLRAVEGVEPVEVDVLEQRGREAGTDLWRNLAALDARSAGLQALHRASRAAGRRGVRPAGTDGSRFGSRFRFGLRS